jgi:hypothetical protein
MKYLAPKTPRCPDQLAIALNDQAWHDLINTLGATEEVTLVGNTRYWHTAETLAEEEWENEGGAILTSGDKPSFVETTTPSPHGSPRSTPTSVYDLLVDG